ncbi:TonB-dependent receptor [Chlorogloeopsis sp. ULAP02]|uniref:TonB-dependent receptor n=1 Tax=Chlorogloeopsis sp. ULAP02 TaxID=3107926 RepID=UPI003134A2B9
MGQQMILKQLLKVGSVTACFWLCMTNLAMSQVIPNQQLQGKSALTKMLRNSSLIRDLPLTSTQVLVQSPTNPPASPLGGLKGSVVQVTGVKANSTDKGMELILQTSKGEELQITNRSTGNSFIVDILNTQLRLPSGETFTFRSEKPIAGITEITVTNFDASTIRVTVTGEADAPIVELFDSPDEGLIFSVASAVASTPSPQSQPSQLESETQQEETSAQDDEPIELLVTGEQDGYFVPNATSATRTDTPLRDIPASIQVVPRQIIEEQQTTQLDEALRNVSGVTSDNTFGVFTEFTVRGFDSAPFLRDGFRQYGAFQVIPETANIETIEVLKGPASILYGDIEPGGLINVVNKKPLPDPFYAAEVQVGSDGFFAPRIDISESLTDDRNLLARLNALYRRDDGFRGYTQPNERLFVAPTLTWKISDRTDLTVGLEYTEDRRPFDAGLVAIGNGVINVPRDRITNEPDDKSEQSLFNVGYTLEHRFSDNWKINNAFRYFNQDYLADFYFPGPFNQSTGILQRSFNTRDINIQTYTLQTNIVGEFATGSIKHKLLLGVDINRQNQDFFGQFAPGFSSPLNIFNPVYRATPRPNLANLPVLVNFTQESDRLGIYLQDQISLFDNLKLLAGLRYDNVEQKTINNPTTVNPRSSETTQSDNAVTPRLGIVYQPIQELSLYASYSQSFTPNSGTAVTGSTLEPERGEGYEVGAKAELFEGKLSATLAYFDITKQNVAKPDPNFPNFSIASGEERSRGIEIDVVGQILPGWNIIAAYAYTDAKVTEDTNRNLIGNRLFNVPQHNASLWTTYTIQKGSLEGLGFGIGFNYVSDREGDLANTFKLGSYFLTNAAVFYQQENYRFAINVKNLFDVEYFGASNSGSRTSGIEPGAPLTVLGSISVQF